MKKGKLLFTMLALSLGCLTGGSGAMAQNGWDAIYSQTQTTSKSWTPIKEGSKTGKVLGSEGTTTYYYITESLDFTNDRTDNDGDGNSGLKIQGTVYLYIPYGLHLTCRGANADGRTGAGAGIELTEGNTLYLIGGGEGASVTAIGGNAASGRNGGDGANATGDYSSEKVTPGRGGNGGNGGGGAGAGIGSRGGTGGTGGEGGNYGEIAYKKEANCVEGKAGTAGGTAAVSAGAAVHSQGDAGSDIDHDFATGRDFIPVVRRVTGNRLAACHFVDFAVRQRGAAAGCCCKLSCATSIQCFGNDAQTRVHRGEHHQHGKQHAE